MHSTETGHNGSKAWFYFIKVPVELFPANAPDHIMTVPADDIFSRLASLIINVAVIARLEHPDIGQAL